MSQTPKWLRSPLHRKQVLSGGEKFKVGCFFSFPPHPFPEVGHFSATPLTQGHPLQPSLLQCACACSSAGTIHHAGCARLYSPHSWSLTVSVVGVQMLTVEAYLEKEAQGELGQGTEPDTQGARVWLAVWPTSEKITEPEREGCHSAELS